MTNPIPDPSDDADDLLLFRFFLGDPAPWARALPHFLFNTLGRRNRSMHARANRAFRRLLAARRIEQVPGSIPPLYRVPLTARCPGCGDCVYNCDRPEPCSCPDAID